MRGKYLSVLIMLIAGAMVSIINIVQKVKLESGLQRLLLVLIIFYIIGSIVQGIIMKVTKPILKIEADETMDETVELDQDEEV